MEAGAAAGRHSLLWRLWFGMDGWEGLCGPLVSWAGGSPQQRKGYLQHSSKSTHCFTVSIKITVLSCFFPGEALQGLWSALRR